MVYRVELCYNNGSSEYMSVQSHDGICECKWHAAEPQRQLMGVQCGMYLHVVYRMCAHKYRVHTASPCAE